MMFAGIKNAIALFLTALCVLAPFAVSAQSQSQFRVGLSVLNNDVTAPSVPTNLSAVGVSTSAIDLTWNPSTDNVAVTGYNIFRDMVLIATTSSTSYTDTGLATSTSYDYTVRAFDAALNYSAHSATSTGTTLDADEDEGGTPSSPDVPKIISLRVVTDATTARIIFTTDQPTRAQVLWGKHEPGDIGSSQEAGYATEHEVFIENLTPDTKYYFEIFIENSQGDTYRLKNQSFRTKPLPADEAPLPPSRFVATGKEKAIDLSWKNPDDPDFSNVRLLRGDTFYPTDPSEGKLIYEGTGEAFTDTDVVPGKRYYYTIYARDAGGAYSAGVIASARVPIPGEVTPPSHPRDPFEEIPYAPYIPRSIEKLSLLDFEFLQRGILLAKRENRVTISALDNLTVRVKYGLLPEVLKTIAVTLADPDDPEKIFTFLLKVNKDKGYYEATLAPFMRGGHYPMTITVLDYQNQKLRRLDGALLADQLATGIGTITDDSYISKYWHLILLFTLLPLLLLVWLWKRRKDEEEIEEGHPPNFTHA